MSANYRRELPLPRILLGICRYGAVRYDAVQIWLVAALGRTSTQVPCPIDVRRRRLSPLMNSHSANPKAPCPATVLPKMLVIWVILRKRATSKRGLPVEYTRIKKRNFIQNKVKSAKTTARPGHYSLEGILKMEAGRDALALYSLLKNVTLIG
jgi:hypothetical protein